MKTMWHIEFDCVTDESFPCWHDSAQSALSTLTEISRKMKSKGISFDPKDWRITAEQIAPIAPNARRVECNIAGQWEQGEWITPEFNGVTGKHLPAWHADLGNTERTLADMFKDMEAQGIEFDRNDWRVSSD